MKLTISIGGFMGSSYRVEWDGESLIYTKFSDGYEPDGDPESIQPTEAQWKRFWKFLGKCSAWDERYESDGVCDGTSWLIEAEKDDFRLSSSGSNAFPEDFQTFLREVKRLIGGRTFN
jgi:hypothetical protein